ncbi:MAG: HipA domain-containing protein [Melioribacteraceae bacterium]|nr:HipA domain-containing protein [Melioribacteraceae bacterium]
MNRCLYCYEEMGDGKDFHDKCSKKIFGIKTPPKINYTLKEIYKLGKTVVEKRITVPGVQTKLSLELKKESQNISKLTIVGLWGNYILKPQSNDYKQLPENEDLTMHLASIFKLNVVDHSLIKLKDNSFAYITKRIDRINNKKVHMEDMCQLTERLTEDKYKGSLEQIDKVIKKHSTNPMFDTIQFFESVLFSFLTGNSDMHLKNYSLIEEGNNIKIAPFYDLLSTRLVISEKLDSEEFALTMRGKKKKISLASFYEFGKSIKMNERQIENVFNGFSKNLKPAIELVDKSFLTKALKESYKELLFSRAKTMELN